MSAWNAREAEEAVVVASFCPTVAVPLLPLVVSDDPAVAVAVMKMELMHPAWQSAYS